MTKYLQMKKFEGYTFECTTESANVKALTCMHI